jgi:hypothetical protein
MRTHTIRLAGRPCEPIGSHYVLMVTTRQLPAWVNCTRILKCDGESVPPQRSVPCPPSTPFTPSPAGPRFSIRRPQQFFTWLLHIHLLFIYVTFSSCLLCSSCIYLSFCIITICSEGYRSNSLLWYRPRHVHGRRYSTGDSSPLIVTCVSLALLTSPVLLAFISQHCTIQPECGQEHYSVGSICDVVGG